jgi:glycosyltransferase involved in cell wall biosynthesis
MTAVEAMACGCPVVISDQVNIWRFVDDAGAGIVVPLDTKHINDALLRVLYDAEYAANMGRAGRALAKEKFSWEAIVGHFDRVYEALVRGERPVSPEISETFGATS